MLFVAAQLAQGLFFFEDFGAPRESDDTGIRHNHRAQALVFRGLGAEPTNKLFAIRPGLHCLQLCKCSTFALLATMSYAKPQFETFSKEKKNSRDRLFVLLL